MAAVCLAAVAIPATSLRSSDLIISGTVVSGAIASTPIAGSAVTLFQAGVAGGAATQLAPPATTDSNGNFSISPSSSLPANAILYLVAKGGDAGGGPNRAIALMSIIGTISSPSSTATLNELTTVAAAYAASNFITNETNIADNSFGALAGAVSGVGNLANSQTGQLGSVISNAANDPSKLDTIANALANCVRAVSTAPPCAQLFAAANVPSTPADTLGAAINMNKAPANGVGAILSLGSSGTYQPTFELQRDCSRRFNARGDLLQ